ncbi:MAG: hypothetical protein E7Z93_02745 [Cyanobacteria bacterium SIG32]|nr:hypothetical protein [Cyanobacteria bacterium SIG32]
MSMAVVILFTTMPCFSADSPEVKATAIKFIMAMGGVVISTFVIFLGLTIYNKLFVERKNIKFNQDDSLTTPNTVEDAVIFFVKKNKLR